MVSVAAVPDSQAAERVAVSEPVESMRGTLTASADARTDALPVGRAWSPDDDDLDCSGLPHSGPMLRVSVAE